MTSTSLSSGQSSLQPGTIDQFRGLKMMVVVCVLSEFLIVRMQSNDAMQPYISTVPLGLMQRWPRRLGGVGLASGWDAMEMSLYLFSRRTYEEIRILVPGFGALYKLRVSIRNKNK